MTNRYTKIARWVIVNGAVAAVAWFALIRGETWAANLLPFYLWINMALTAVAFLMVVGLKTSSNPEAAALLAKLQGSARSVPPSASFLFDVLLTGLLASQGWPFYAALVMIQSVMHLACYPNKPAPDSST